MVAYRETFMEVQDLNNNYEFLTVKNHVEIIEYIQKSKFISQVFPLGSESEAIDIINKVKKNHYKATHNVYAYVIGENKEIQKSTDDGEPSGTAGIPVLEIIKKENLNNVLIVVTRYFGGIKLGAGGLIRSYAHMAKLGIDGSVIIKNVLCEKIKITIDYTYWSKIENESNNMGILIQEVEFLDKVSIYLLLQEDEKEKFINFIEDTTNGNFIIETFGFNYVSLGR